MENKEDYFKFTFTAQVNGKPFRVDSWGTKESVYTINALRSLLYSDIDRLLVEIEAHSGHFPNDHLKDDTRLYGQPKEDE